MDLDLGNPPGDHPSTQVVTWSSKEEKPKWEEKETKKVLTSKLDPRSRYFSSPGNTVCRSEHPLMTDIV